MNRERRTRIEDAFDAVIEAALSERSRVLAEVCAGDDELLSEVEAMLEAHDRAEGLLEHGAHAVAASLVHEVQPIEPRLGAYRILRELGRGGMGVVYLGERDDGQFRRQVAIKIMRDPDPQLQARMLAERQILASLQHPNIAALLDGGVTHDGRPYLVMEHVEGLPIDVHCDRMRLSVPQRLRLFIVVARAVDHAHRNLVVHRDLKPSNILVTTSGAVKLLDFGIAKLLNPSLGPTGHPQTRPEQRVLTPEYASPEQIRGETLTTASDVYSLGVILYELLSGQPPYRLEGLTTPQVLEVVCERDPAPPSARVTVNSASVSGELGSPTVSAAVAEARAAQTPERLQRALRGDLDAIVAMALRKEPTRRYGSAELFAQDIGAYLDGRPVSARKGTRRYRIGKVLRRNRAATIASALIVLSLVAGAVVALWQAGLAGRERDRAEQALTASQEALRQSDEISAFLMSLFEAGDPASSPGEEVTARDLLRRGIARADQLADQPLVQARMLGVMGHVYEIMARYEEAQQLTERAIATRQAVLGA
ncbi:MAG: serine/threonine protein kinase, partial [Longimicrobiales bacterium]